MKNSWLFAALFGALLLGALASFFLKPAGIEKDPKAEYLQGGNFALESVDGKVSLEQFKGSPTVLYFGFTFCPDICPIGLSVIRDAIKTDEQLEQFNVLFVTVDPERDTAERLKEYLDFFNSSFTGLTGTLDEISAVAKLYGTYFAKAKPDENGGYTVDHTAYFYVIDQNGELVRVLDHDTDANTLASVLIQLI